MTQEKFLVVVNIKIRFLDMKKNLKSNQNTKIPAKKCVMSDLVI